MQLVEVTSRLYQFDFNLFLSFFTFLCFEVRLKKSMGTLDHVKDMGDTDSKQLALFIVFKLCMGYNKCIERETRHIPPPHKIIDNIDKSAIFSPK